MRPPARPAGGLAGVAVALRERPGAGEALPASLPWQQPREVMERFVDLLYQRRKIRAAFESCVAGAGFLDHTPSGCMGRHAAIESLARRLSDPAWQGEVLSLLVDGDQAAVHLLVHDGLRQRRRVDMFRLAQGRIVEHWGFVAAEDLPELPAAQAESRTTS